MEAFPKREFIFTLLLFSKSACVAKANVNPHDCLSGLGVVGETGKNNCWVLIPFCLSDWGIKAVGVLSMIWRYQTALRQCLLLISQYFLAM